MCILYIGQVPVLFMAETFLMIRKPPNSNQPDPHNHPHKPMMQIAYPSITAKFINFPPI